ncbi:MAG: DUF2281 domain-containing protein [Flavobacteriales bacterium]|jgi:hypothetical protein
MTSLTLYTQIEALPSKLKKEAKKMLKEMLENQGKDKSKVSSIKKRTFGSLKGKIHLADDFDSPLEDFNEYM